MKTKKHYLTIMPLLVLGILCTIIMSFTGCARSAEAQDSPADSPPRVYFTTDISSAGIMALYEALGLEATGNVAVKVHTGEPGNPHFTRPELIGELVQRVNVTFIETNVAYGGRRATTASHLQVAEEHGFTAIAPVVILDDGEDLVFPVTGGKHLTENLVGGKFNDFDFHVVISHFKGHTMGGFGGALKNLSIGYASSAGKLLIHTAGRSRTNWMPAEQDEFVEAMAEAAKTITDRIAGKAIYINVMNHLSVDCDCVGNPEAPTMADIGILASLDPVALDQACIDLAFAAPDAAELIERVESRKGRLILDHAEYLGMGSKTYVLVRL